MELQLHYKCPARNLKSGSMKLQLTAVVALILCACGGGSGNGGGGGGGGGENRITSPQAETPTVSIQIAPITPASCDPIDPSKVVRIQLFGDSTQWGYLDASPGLRADIYPELALQREMDARFGAGAVEVSTRAVSGTTSSWLLAGTDGLNLPWPQSVNAEIVVMNHGINDANPGYGISQETYRANLMQLATAPATVVFETPLPVNQAKADYAQIMRDVATLLGITVADTNAYARTIPAWFQKYATEGVHLNSIGYEGVVRNALYPTLEPMVTKLRCK